MMYRFCRLFPVVQQEILDVSLVHNRSPDGRRHHHPLIEMTSLPLKVLGTWIVRSVGLDAFRKISAAFTESNK